MVLSANFFMLTKKDFLSNSALYVHHPLRASMFLVFCKAFNSSKINSFLRARKLLHTWYGSPTERSDVSTRSKPIYCQEYEIVFSWINQ